MVEFVPQIVMINRATKSRSKGKDSIDFSIDGLEKRTVAIKMKLPNSVPPQVKQGSHRCN